MGIGRWLTVRFGFESGGVWGWESGGNAIIFWDWGHDHSATVGNFTGRNGLCGVYLSVVESMGTAAPPVPGLDGDGGCGLGTGHDGKFRLRV